MEDGVDEDTYEMSLRVKYNDTLANLREKRRRMMSIKYPTLTSIIVIVSQKMQGDG